MFTCPHCRTTLVRRKSAPLGLVWVCPSCGGRAMSVELLRKAIPPPLVNRLWQRARSGHYPANRSCPACRRRMTEVPVAPTAEKTLCIDVCAGCHFVWFDPTEFEAFPRLHQKPAASETLSPQAKEALALMRLDAVKRQQSTPLGVENDVPDHWWEFAVARYGIQIEYNDTPLRSQPIATWVLAVLIAGISLVAFRDLPAVVNEWGLIPAEFTRHFGLTFLTSFFLHGGLFHLIGNLYFLVVFGDNTEDVLGQRRYLLLVALAAMVGDIVHIFADPRANVPCIGASGGISGILAYYCLRFPRASVGVVWWFHWFRIPVGVMFALWVLMQLLDAWLLSAGIGNVAVFAHLGGAGVGVAFWLWTRRSLSAHETMATATPPRPS